MAIEAYMVAFDIQAAGSGYQKATPTAKLGAKEEVTIGTSEFEGKGASNGSNGTKSGLLAHNGTNVVRCLMTEVLAGSAAEAVEVVRERYAQNSGGERTVVKPNETNFQVIV